MASPGQHPTLVHVQNCMDAAEQSAVDRWNAEAARPLRAQLGEILRDAERAADAGARLDAALAALRV